jgi:hypothetical protein
LLNGVPYQWEPSEMVCGLDELQDSAEIEAEKERSVFIVEGA